MTIDLPTLLCNYCAFDNIFQVALDFTATFGNFTFLGRIQNFIDAIGKQEKKIEKQNIKKAQAPLPPVVGPRVPMPMGGGGDMGGMY